MGTPEATNAVEKRLLTFAALSAELADYAFPGLVLPPRPVLDDACHQFSANQQTIKATLEVLDGAGAVVPDITRAAVKQYLALQGPATDAFNVVFVQLHGGATREQWEAC